MTRLVSISAPAGGGKDYLANYLVNQGFVKMKFASPLYEAVSIITGLKVADVEDVKEGKFDWVPSSLLPQDKTQDQIKNNMRKILQMVGTEIGRDLWNQNNWVNHLERRIKKLQQEISETGDSHPTKGIVITDTRFTNEFELLESLGFIMLDISSPDEHLRIKSDDPKWNHPSERALDAYRANGRFHYTIFNDRTTDAKEMLSKALPWDI